MLSVARQALRRAVVLLTLVFSTSAAAIVREQPWSTADEIAIQAAVRAFFEALSRGAEQAKDLWSGTVTDRAAQEQSLRQRLTAGVMPGSSTMSNVTITADNASVRVSLERSSPLPPDLDAWTVHDVFDVTLIRESDGWKMARAESAFDRLAEALVKAPPEGRNALLASEPSLLTPTLASSLADAGDRLVRRGQAAAAVDPFRIAEAVSIALRDEKGQARALVRIGRTAWLTSELARALDPLHRALEISESLQDDLGIAAAVTEIAQVRLRQGEFEAAQQHFERALILYEKLDHASGRAANLSNLGMLSETRGRSADAVEFYRRSLEISSTLRDTTISGNVLNNLGILYYQDGDFAQALQYYLKSLAVRQASGSQVGSNLNNIAVLYLEQRNYRYSRDYFAKALAFYESVKNRGGIADALVGIGQVWGMEGDAERELEQYQRALEVSQALGDQHRIATVLHNIGHLQRRQGAYAQASESLEKSRALFHQVNDSRAVALTLVQLAEVNLKQGTYARGLQLIEEAKLLADQMGLERASEAHTVAAALYRATKQPDNALAELKEAISLIESVRTRVAGGQGAQQLYFESKLAPYHSLVDVYIDLGNPGEALLAAQRAKARALLDVVHNGRTDTTTTMTAAERQQETALIGQLAELNNQRFKERMRPNQNVDRVNAIDAQLEQARLALETFQVNLYAAHPELRLRRADTPPLTLDDIGDLLPDANTVVLEFLVAEESTTLFVVRPPNSRERASETKPQVHIATFRLNVSHPELAGRIERFRGMLANVDTRYARSARELYDLLLGPAAGELRRGDRLVVVPDGPLWELPFQVLQTPQSQDLIDRHALFLAPSLSVLRESMKRRAQRAENIANRPPTVLAFGNPTLGGESVGRVQALMDERLELLPEAERQVRALEQLYGATRSDVYVGDEAREERLKADARSYRVLHVATHGILNDRNPMYSHLVMAQQKGGVEDGLLEAREIMQLEMTADVAVLSACETARGRVGRGEGMIGLTWALLVAGVPTTVVSQWKVRSDSTAELMIAFHRRLRERLSRPAGQRDIAGALRMAALEVKRDPRYRHPFYWAPFVVVGAGY
jgi:CHAT domain-containing protein/Tfp pilus assembly protein PilF